ncbi:hypothetical protein CCR80_13765 [Rhodothalassium salexigens]|uniref:ComEC/Rec2 family competence protein n=1 Tax=Rhodothalassium salexigens TaxID=1086 RepID=UPI00191435AE|nr:ComEC/Rec2 family competence protein [Rhodothalassium salexigens]MBK5922103.1 hypothetical protein [Rhodothalassium salexigens]
MAQGRQGVSAADRIAAALARDWRRRRAGLALAFAAQARRGLLWAPVALGGGVAVYFALPVEPPLALTLLAVAAALAGGVVAGWRAPVLLLVLVAAGPAVGAWRTAQVAAPVLARETGAVPVTGRLLAQGVDAAGVRRLTLAPERLGRLDDAARPARVRVSVRTAAPPLRPGDRVRLTAVLAPPPGPAAPGAFDFARQAYFARLGGVGYAVSAVERLDPGDNRAGRAGWGAWLQGVREGVASRVRAVVPGAEGGVAAALLTGLRGGIPSDTAEALRVAGLAHLLAISGLHVGLVAAGLFFTVRAGLALWPWLAVHWPIKAMAAAVAWAGAGGYVLLAGATVPTLRAFIMVSLSLLALMAGRRPISLRLVAVAALAILVARPEALVSAGFQMSFAAVVALVAVYDRAGPALARWRRDAPPGRRLALYFLALLLSTLVAELAIAPFAAYQFQRLGFYGLAANMVAVPLMSLAIMPLALVALVLMPLGLDALALRPMGWAVGVVLDTATAVAAWPGADIGVKAFPAAALGLVALGGLVAALGGQRALMAPAALLLAAGLAWAASAGRPDLFVDREARLVAWVRDGRLWLSHPARGAYDREQWRRLSGLGGRPGGQVLDQAGASGDRAMAEGVAHGLALRCDPLGCAGRLDGRPQGLLDAPLGRHRSGRWVAVAFDRAALADDCRRADILVALVPVTGRACPAPRLVVDRRLILAAGAVAIDLDAEPPRLVTAAGVRGLRPWVRPHPARRP